MSLVGEETPRLGGAASSAEYAAGPEAFFSLLKPRVMSLVVLTALAGMLVAPGSVHPVVGFAALLAISIGAGAAGALNMWWDCDIDALMARTRLRAVPSGLIAPGEALYFGLTLSLLAVLTLATVANFLAGALLAFTIFAGFYYWFPKMTGYMYDETLAKWHFWLLFIGVNVIFFPQHFLGLAGMPRRYVDYPDAYHFWNVISSIGALISLVATVLFLYLLYEAFERKRVAGDNPWGVGATTLEWTLPSPPPFHTYETLPRITGADH